MPEKTELSVYFSQSVGSSGTLGALLQEEQVLVRTDAGEPPHSAVGLFRMPTPVGEFAELMKILNQLQAAGPVPPGQDPPGTPMVSFGLKDGEETKAAWSAAATEIPALLQPAVGKIRRLIDQSFKHPVSAVGAQGSWQAGSFAAGQDLEIELVAKNIGGEPAVFANPAAGDEGSSGVQLTLIRNRTPQQSGDITFHELVRTEIRQLEADGVTLVDGPGEAIDLAAGKEIAFSLRKTVRLAPGEYQANLSFVIIPAGEADGPAIGGTITMDLPLVTITR